MKLFSYLIPKRLIYHSHRLLPYQYDIENQYQDYSFLEDEILQYKKIFSFFDKDGYIIDIQDLYQNIHLFQDLFTYLKIDNQKIFHFIRPNTYYSFFPESFSKCLYGIFHYYFSIYFSIKSKDLIESIEKNIPYEWFVYYIHNYGIEKLSSSEIEKMIEYKRFDLFHYSYKYHLIPENKNNILIYVLQNKKNLWLHAFIEDRWFFPSRVIEYMIIDNLYYELNFLLTHYPQQYELKSYLYLQVQPKSIHILELLYHNGCKPTTEFINHCCYENKIMYLQWSLRYNVKYTIDSFRLTIQHYHEDCFYLLYQKTMAITKNKKINGYLYNLCIHYQNKKIAGFLWDKLKN